MTSRRWSVKVTPVLLPSPGSRTSPPFFPPTVLNTAPKELSLRPCYSNSLHGLTHLPIPPYTSGLNVCVDLQCNFLLLRLQDSVVSNNGRPYSRSSAVDRYQQEERRQKQR